MAKPVSPDPNAEDALRRKVKDGLASPEDYTKLGGLLFFMGNSQEAVTFYQQAITLAPTNLQKARVCIEFGWAQYAMGQQGDAQLLAQRSLEFVAAETDRLEVVACRGSGQTLLAQVEWTRDIEAWRRAAFVALKTLERVTDEAAEFEGKAEAYFDKAVLHEALGNTDIAIPLCEKLLQCELQDWDCISVLTVYGRALRGTGRFRAAQQKLEEAIQHTKKKNYKPLLSNLYIELGITQRLSGPPTEPMLLTKAQHTFQQALLALEADPYRSCKSDLYTEVYINIAAACYDAGDFRGAAGAYEEILESTPEGHHFFSEAQLWLGRCHQAEGSYTVARPYFEKVLASSHASEDQKLSARENLARSLYELREYRKASEILKELASLYPQDDFRKMSKVLWLGFCYEGLGDHGTARETYEEVIASPHALADDKTAAEEGLRRLPRMGKETSH